jgi:hypothetical protein
MKLPVKTGSELICVGLRSADNSWLKSEYLYTIVFVNLQCVAHWHVVAALSMYCTVGAMVLLSQHSTKPCIRVLFPHFHLGCPTRATTSPRGGGNHKSRPGPVRGHCPWFAISIEVPVPRCAAATATFRHRRLFPRTYARHWVRLCMPDASYSAALIHVGL